MTTESEIQSALLKTANEILSVLSKIVQIRYLVK